MPSSARWCPSARPQGYRPKHPFVAAHNPKGQVPVLVDGDLVLFDSTLIFEYLEDRYPVPPLMPAEAAARARCRLLELAADEILLPHVVKLMYRTEPPAPEPERRREQRRAATAAEKSLCAHYAALDKALEGCDYLCGAFSVADIATFMTILFILRLKGPELEPYPHLAAWYACMRERPAVARAAAEIAAADRLLSRQGAKPKSTYLHS